MKMDVGFVRAIRLRVENLPVEITKKEKPDKLKALFEEAGYQITIVEFEDIGFLSIWGCEKGSRCKKCKASLLTVIQKALQ